MRLTGFHSYYSIVPLQLLSTTTLLWCGSFFFHNTKNLRLVFRLLLCYCFFFLLFFFIFFSLNSPCLALALISWLPYITSTDIPEYNYTSISKYGNCFSTLLHFFSFLFLLFSRSSFSPSFSFSNYCLFLFFLNSIYHPSSSFSFSFLFPFPAVFFFTTTNC